MFDVQLPAVVRFALQVATAVAEEVMDNLRYPHRKWGERRDHQVRPVLLRVREKADGAVQCTYEGGTVVEVFLRDANAEDRLAYASWEVTHINVRYVPLDANCVRAAFPGEKTRETWGPVALAELKKLRWWHSPTVTTGEQGREVMLDARRSSEELAAERIARLGRRTERRTPTK